MPQITLEDYQLSSDDEYHEDIPRAEGNSVHDSINESGEEEIAGNLGDSDPYGRFSNDSERFAWDNVRWSDISNVRKHHKKTTKAEKDKTEEQGKLKT